MKAPRARCPVCFQLVLADRPSLEALEVGDFYFIEEHKKPDDEMGSKRRTCAGSDTRIAAFKLEAYR